MNAETQVAVCCYAGDVGQVREAHTLYAHHEVPVICFSPSDFPGDITHPQFTNIHVGRAAYIGQESLDRQRRHIEILLQTPANWFLLNDSDSFCLTPKLPPELFRDESRIWSNEVTDPRPHPSPYPKIAMQPPYFFSRSAAERMLAVAHRCPAHPVTPYIDHFMLQLSCEAGLTRAAFTQLEHAAKEAPAFTGTDPWEQLAYRIRYLNATFMHPIKTLAQVRLCVEARQKYEQPT